MLDTLKSIINLVKKSYLKGIEDILSQILTENYNLEKINELYTKIKESKALNFENKILKLALE